MIFVYVAVADGGSGGSDGVGRGGGGGGHGVEALRFSTCYSAVEFLFCVLLLITRLHIKIQYN